MIINAEPMASGASAPAPGSMTVIPTVMTRKNAPMNSTRYFFIGLKVALMAGRRLCDTAGLGERKNAVVIAFSADAEQFHLEDQRRVWRDGAGITFATISQFRRNGELHLVADFHLCHALIPAGNDHAGAEHKAERLVAVNGTVELLAVGEGAGVMDRHGLALFRSRAVAGHEFFNFQFWI